MDERKKFENGIYDISNDDYHRSLGISRSSLMAFKRSPYHYWYKFLADNPLSSESSHALVMGNLIHTLVLEPNKFDEEFVIRPPMDKRTNAGKLAFNHFQASLAGRIGITREEYELAEHINDAVYSNDLASNLLIDCDIEKSIYFTHESTGIQCKVRPDAMNGSIVVDLKTTKDASFRAFQNSAYNFGYFLQAGMISEALKSMNVILDKFIIIAVEKEAPNAVALYVLDIDAIEYGVNQFNSLMSLFAECAIKDKWPGYGIHTLTLPNYFTYDIEMELNDE